MIELDNIKLQTTWNDAAQSINLNFATIDIVVERLSAALENAGVSFDSIEMWKLLGLGTAEQIASTHLTDALASYATQAYVTAEINALIGGAPSTLDTLKEIADAIAAGGTAMDALVVTVGEKASQSDLNAAVTRVAALETLTTTGKVHNSDLLDGIDSLGFVRIAETGEQVMSGSLKLVNLTATGSISAMSANPLADNIGMGGMDTEAMWQELRTSSTDPDKVIDISHIPNLTTAKITDIETWISGKGYLTSIPVASDSVLGGIKLGFPASSVEGLGFNVPVLLDSANRAYVSIDIRDVDDMYGYTPVAPSAIADMATKTWVGGNYLPLSGGTINGNDSKPLWINTSYTEGIEIPLRINGVNKGYFGWWNDWRGVFMYSAATGGCLAINDTDGKAYYNNKELIHTGNIGSQRVDYANSAGNASTVEGYGISRLVKSAGRYSSELNLNTYTENVIRELYPYEVSTPGSPIASYGILLNFWDANDITAAQLVFNSQSNGFWYRSKQSPYAEIPTPWRKVLDSQSTFWGATPDGDGNIHIGSPATMPYLYFKRYDSDGWAGYVGIGSSSNDIQITTNGYAEGAIYLSNKNGYVYLNPSGRLGINIYNPAYPLDVNGDSYTSEWSRAGHGFFVEGAIVYYSAVTGYASIASNGDEICISGNNNSTLYVNYRKGVTGYAPTEWVWNDGTPSSYAKFRLGELETYGDIISHGSISAQTANPLADMIGSSGEYLPLTGGTISGVLNVRNDLYAYYFECFGPVYASGDVYSEGNMQCDGVCYASEFSTSSDYRLKDIHDTYNVDFGKLKAIPKVFFTWKNGDTQTMQFGTIAQEVEKVMPEIVRTNGKGYKSVNYDRFGLVALAAIDVLHTTQETQEEKIVRLEKRVKELESWKETRLRMQS